MSSGIFRKEEQDKMKFYPSTGSLAKTEIVKEIIGFYNSDGGSIVFGIKKNGFELNYRGLRLEQKKFIEEILAEIECIENKYCTKILEKEVEFYEEKEILILHINKGNSIIELEKKFFSMNYRRMQVIEIDKLIFISHSSKDREYGEILINELRSVGLREEQIKFSSNDEYGIESGNILDKIKMYIRQNAYMIYLVSDNYFESPICLNEMGAAWILNNKYQVIGVPGFKLDNQFLKRSVVKNDEIAFNLDNKERMLKLKKIITEKFNL